MKIKFIASLALIGLTNSVATAVPVAPILDYRPPAILRPPVLPAVNRINCPLTQARVEMVSPLPSGWWRTPNIRNLQATSIKKIRGKQILTCKYGDHGVFNVMRNVPIAWDCSRRQKGFDCVVRRPASNRPVTFKTGAIELKQTYLLDLDYGVVRPQGADIWFQAKTATRRFITPRNGAKIAIAGTRSVNLAGCKRLPLSNRSISLSSVPVGTYICAKTNQGRYSQFRINAPRVGRSPGKLHIGYTTWKK